MEKALEGLALESIKVLDEVEIATREKEGKRFVFIMNFSDKPSRIFLKKKFTELIKEKRLEGEVILNPFEVLILI